jgi:hypothetical protein
MDRVEAVIRAHDPKGQLFGTVLRDTYDLLYDGGNTGRYSPAELRTTEKAHMGSLVEIKLHRAFDFADGDEMDYKIDGIEVDCKFSNKLGAWMIPPQAVRGPHLLLVVWADDQLGRWTAGLVRAREFATNGARLITEGANWDRKSTLNVAGQSTVRYLYSEQLPENLLLQLDPATRAKILDPQPRYFKKPTGQDRINMVFRLVQHRLVNRGTIVTLGQQKDPMKRARAAREQDRLGREGILIFGHQDGEKEAAIALKLPPPRKGSLVSARVVLAESGWTGPEAEIEGSRWRLAQSGDPVTPAPVMPKPGRKKDEDDDDAVPAL